MDLLPDLKAIIHEFRKDDYKDLIAIVSQLAILYVFHLPSQQLVDEAFSEGPCNSGSLKHAALQYIIKDYESCPFNALILKSKMKSDRGFNHPMIAWMLWPRGRLDEFDTDSE
jgi:hypothetical protein